MRIRANSTLANLTEDQLNEIFDRIASGERYRDVQKHCAQQPPDGFGLHVHLKTLCHFYKSERRRRHAEELAEARFLKLDSEDPTELLQNVRVELAHACFDLANDPQPSAINALSRVTHRIEVVRLEQQRADTDQQRLALERDHLAEKIRQFNFNAAKQAAIYALQIKEVLKDKTLDVEQKVWKVNNIIFGASTNPPSQTMAPSAPDQPSTHCAVNQLPPTQRNHRAPSPDAERSGEKTPPIKPTTHSAADQLSPTQHVERAPSPRGEGRGEGPTHAHDEPSTT